MEGNDTSFYFSPWSDQENYVMVFNKELEFSFQNFVTQFSTFQGLALFDNAKLKEIPQIP